MGSVQQIWHGDSIEHCQRFKEGRVNCIITDPPFGVDNQSNMAVTQSGKEHARKIANDESPEQAIEVYKAVMDVLLPKTSAEADMYVFTSYQVLTEWLAMTAEFMPKYGFHRKALITWEKDGPGMGDLNCPWGMGSEIVMFFQKGPRTKTAKRRNSVVHMSQLRPEELIHPHEKPEGLYQLFAGYSTTPGQTLVDPFGGSGVLARAVRKMGDRTAISIELNKKNYDLAKAKLDGTSEGFDFA